MKSDRTGQDRMGRAEEGEMCESLKSILGCPSGSVR